MSSRIAYFINQYPAVSHSFIRREILALERQGFAGWARVVLEPANLGFGRGCNSGLAPVKSPYTLFLNPDAAIEPSALRTMLEFMEQRAGAGIVGPATLCGSRDHPQLQPTGPYPTPWSVVREAAPFLRRRSSAVTIVPGAPPMRTGWVCGALLMIRSSLARQLGGFDPRFFLYWEEVDLCRRAEHAGFENWVLGTAVAHHVVDRGKAMCASSRRGIARASPSLDEMLAAELDAVHVLLPPRPARRCGPAHPGVRPPCLGRGIGGLRHAPACPPDADLEVLPGDVLKELVEHLIRDPNRKIPSDWDSRSQRARYDSSKTRQALGWRPAGTLIGRGIVAALRDSMA